MIDLVLMYIVAATTTPGLANELDRIEQMYALQKTKNVEFLNSVENVRYNFLKDTILAFVCSYLALPATKLWKINVM